MLHRTARIVARAAVRVARGRGPLALTSVARAADAAARSRAAATVAASIGAVTAPAHMYTRSRGRALHTTGHAAAAGAGPAAKSAESAAKSAATSTGMFCFQCEQTSEQKGCTTVGVCGKLPATAKAQDLLIELSKGISAYARRARDLGAAYVDRELDRFVMESLFATMTNVNFDTARFVAECHRAVALRDRAKALYARACQETGTKPDAAVALQPAVALELPKSAAEDVVLRMAEAAGVQAHTNAFGADVNGLKELALYGLKGTCAYAEHCSVLSAEDASVFRRVHELLDDIANVTDVQALLGAAMRVGALNYDVMQLLDNTHTTRYGHPVPTAVPTVPVPGPCVLVSGHDLHDLELLLKQCDAEVAAGKERVNVYTHGEMLPAHSYPQLKAYTSLAGHYGGPWQLQKMEFAQFPGAILMTSNCIIEPAKRYKSRIFTRRVVGWPGVKHLANADDLSPLTTAARQAGGFTADDCAEFTSKPLQTGFGRNTVLSVAGTVVDGVKSGALKHFFVIGGCDGSEGERNYFRELAKATPRDTVILTLGCGKYRINNLDLGNTSVGIPRVLDMGQCNDAYGAIQVAVALAKAFGTDVNSLPLSFALSWFEQKAVAVLLTLLHLGVKNIRIGPHLPAFLTPTLAHTLTDTFNLMKCDSADARTDLLKMMTANANANSNSNPKTKA